MLLFLARDLALSYEGREIFRNAGLEVACGEKVALVGANGVGKSSLLRMIAGTLQPDRGQIRFFKPTQRALLDEALDDMKEVTVTEYLTQALVDTGTECTLGEVASRFGFDSKDIRQLNVLSGGEKTRLQLARIWLGKPDLLLLDEPTNHLDSDHLDWLEQFIGSFRGAVVVVSHDRYFLDRSVTRVVELQAEEIASFPGNYSDFARAKQQQFESELKTYFDQQRQARKLQQAIVEQEEWAGRGHRESRKKARAEGPTMGGKEYYRAKVKKMDRRVKNNVKRLERMQKEQITQPRRAETVYFDAGRSSRFGGNALLTGSGISKSYGKRQLFDGVSFALTAGAKVGLIGVNGSGKSTLVKMVLGREESDTGTWWFSPALRVGYLDQELEVLDGNKTVLTEVAGANRDVKAVRNLLAGLLFKGESVDKLCAVLSMGERVRVGLAKLLVKDCNLLVLDEPTNYLDLPSREKLEELLQNFQGALVIVSHDRYLLQRVCTAIWSIENRELKVYPGSYDEYLESKNQPRVGATAETKLELEVRKARLLGELSLVDRRRFPGEYERLEAEYREIMRRL